MSLLRLIVAACLTSCAFYAPLRSEAQKNELAFLVGGEFIPSNALAFAPPAGTREIRASSSLALQLNYGREIHSFHRTALWLDVPALVGPNHKITGSSPLLPTSNATFYVTPAARLTFPSARPWTPWVSVGGGYGLFETSDAYQGGAANPTIHTHTGVLQFGGGVDVRTPLHLFFPIGLRGEFRDFYALDSPIFAVPVTGQTQHNLTAGGGLTARF